MPRKTILTLIALLSIAPVWLAWSGTAVADSVTPPTCQAMPEIPVTLNGAAHNVAGWLCWQGELTNQTVQVLTAGISYDHNYWDWPMNPGQYSYVQQATTAGYATFTYDRLGTGLSDHPDAVSVNMFSEADVLHQLVQGLRAGTVGTHAFNKVITVGHSYGSAVTGAEANTNNDVDGVIISGLTHVIAPANLVLFSTSFGPAQLDPKFASAGLPLGYLTTFPGTRDNLFYHTPNADPAVIALDETLKDTTTAGQLATVGANMLPTSTSSINAPVLVAMGQKDVLFCDNLLLSCASSSAITTRENIYYNAHACLEGYSLANAGHDLNLHLNAPNWFGAANNWADRRVGTGSTAATQVCP